MKGLGVLALGILSILAVCAGVLWWGLLGSPLESPPPNAARVPPDWSQPRAAADYVMR